MQFHWFKNLLLALALIATQGAGLVHSIEHREHLDLGNLVHKKGQHSSDKLFHSCLLVDGLSTAHTPVANSPGNFPKPVLSPLRVQLPSGNTFQNTLFIQRVRVRDPPLYS